MTGTYLPQEKRAVARLSNDVCQYLRKVNLHCLVTQYNVGTLEEHTCLKNYIVVKDSLNEVIRSREKINTLESKINELSDELIASRNIIANLNKEIDNLKNSGNGVGTGTGTGGGGNGVGTGNGGGGGGTGSGTGTGGTGNGVGTGTGGGTGNGVGGSTGGGNGVGTGNGGGGGGTGSGTGTGNGTGSGSGVGESGTGNGVGGGGYW